MPVTNTREPMRILTRHYAVLASVKEPMWDTPDNRDFVRRLVELRDNIEAVLRRVPWEIK